MELLEGKFHTFLIWILYYTDLIHIISCALRSQNSMQLCTFESIEIPGLEMCVEGP